MPMRSFFLKMDGRWIAAGILASFSLLLVATSFVVAKPVFELPPFAWFGPMAPYFADLRGVVSCSDQFHAGQTHFTELRDPWNRPLNYPYWWLYVHDLGVNTGNVMAVGEAMDALFFIAAFFVLGRLTFFGGLVAGLFLISYAVLLGLERANVDLLMFALLALALAWRRFSPVPALLIGLAAVLKVHPLFAFAALLVPPWKKSLPWLGAGLVFFILGMTVHLHDFISILGTTPNMRTGVLSYGMTALGLEFMERYHRPELYGLVLIFGVALIILVTGASAWIRPTLTLDAEDDRELFAFRIGAGIYLGSFFLGTNHDYRLVFLLFCLPLLLLTIERDLPVRRWAFATVMLMLLSVNWLYLAGDGEWPQFVLKQTAGWALFFCVAGIFIETLPPALQGPRRVRGRLASCKS